MSMSGKAMVRDFREFDKLNPNVFDRLVEEALKIRRTGNVKQIGLAVLWERLRYDNLLSTTGAIYRLDNTLMAAYARSIMEEVEELDGFFRTRTSKVDS